MRHVQIYLMGGEGAKGAPLTSIEKYDPATNKWAKVADLPIARLEAACAAVGNTILIAGGYQPAAGEFRDRVHPEDCWFKSYVCHCVISTCAICTPDLPCRDLTAFKGLACGRWGKS